MNAVVQAVADGRIQYGDLWDPLATWILRDRDDVAAAPGGPCSR